MEKVGKIPIFQYHVPSVQLGMCITLLNGGQSSGNDLASPALLIVFFPKKCVVGLGN